LHPVTPPLGRWYVTRLTEKAVGCQKMAYCHFSCLTLCTLFLVWMTEQTVKGFSFGKNRIGNRIPGRSTRQLNFRYVSTIPVSTSRFSVRCANSILMVASDAAGVEVVDPFESIRQQLPKESYDLLVSNVDPASVNAVDLVRTSLFSSVFISSHLTLCGLAAIINSRRGGAAAS
jgi:hypothetical protein